MAGGYETVPGTGADALEMADPGGFTGKTAENLFGAQADNMFKQGNNATNQWMMDSSDPGSMMSKFLSDFGGLQKSVTDSTSPLAKQLQSNVTGMTKDSTNQIASQMAGLGGLRSSGMSNLAGEKAGEIAGRAGSELSQMQMSLLNSLAGQQLGGRQQAMSQMMGQPMQMMGLQNQFGAPTYVQPQVAAKQTATDWMSGIGDVLSGIGSIIPL